MQCACAILSPIPRPSVQYFSTFSHKRHDFRKEKLLNTKCVSISSANFYRTFLILRITERDMIKNVYWSSCKVALSLSHFNETWIFFTDFGRICKNKISRKSVQQELNCSTRTDRHVTKQVVFFFSQFCERVQNEFL